MSFEPKVFLVSVKLKSLISIITSLDCLIILSKLSCVVRKYILILLKVITLLLLILIKYKFIGGFEFYVVGKISVGGNARTRTLNTIFGLRSRSRL